jgi:hypothetical protein
MNNSNAQNLLEALEKIYRKEPLSFMGDISRKNVVDISQKPSSQAVGQSAITVEDPEVINLLRWLAKTQGITTEVALKKAVATAAYIYDTTTNQGGKLFVQRPDKSVGEILLK